MGKLMEWLHGIDSDEIQKAVKVIYEVAQDYELEGKDVESVQFYNYPWRIHKFRHANDDEIIVVNEVDNSSIGFIANKYLTEKHIYDGLVNWCMQNK